MGPGDAAPTLPRFRGLTASLMWLEYDGRH